MHAKVWTSRWRPLAAAGIIVGMLVLTAHAKELVADKTPVAQAKSVDKPAPAPKKLAAKTVAVDGHELFTREWLPKDSRAHGGDGLGPVFNDSSCIACHNQGGTGGAGPANKNVDIITAFPLPAPLAAGPGGNDMSANLFNALFGGLAPPVASQPTPGPAQPAVTDLKKFKAQQKEQMAKLHPGFLSARSVVLHHFGLDPKYAIWRQQMLDGQMQQQAVFMGSSGPVSNVVTAEEIRVVHADATPGTVADKINDTPATPKPTDVTALEVSPGAPTPSTPIGEVPAAQVSTPPNAVIGFAGPAMTVAQAMPQISAANPEIAQLQNASRRNAAGNMTFQSGTIQVSHSQRNATALFGIGKLDAIPETAIVEMAKLEREKYPDAAGRPSKQKDGRIGRFGWKAQKPTLEDFALTACAIELGLNVPDHEQSGLALDPKYKAPGLDMDRAECNALVGFLKSLPTPSERKPATEQETTTMAAGHKLFASTGCANCHSQKLATVEGLYSDLLLHDMGPELGDTGSYGVFTPDQPDEDQNQQPLDPTANPFAPEAQAKLTPAQLDKVVGAMRQEWRTPPLWGVRDSGPYLHDGRADTLEQAIAFHGGQASSSTLKFFALKPEERQQVIAFLKSLTAPEQPAVVAMK